MRTLGCECYNQCGVTYDGDECLTAFARYQALSQTYNGVALQTSVAQILSTSCAQSLVLETHLCIERVEATHDCR